MPDFELLPQEQEQAERKGGCFDNLNPDASALPMPELTAGEARLYKQLQWIQYLMDDATTVPCTGGRTIGLDPVIGLIPFFGDFGSAIVSSVLVARASKVVSKYTVTRMMSNVAIDAAVGTIPLVGDLFDFGWKANTRNVTIFENHMKLGAQRQRQIDKTYVWSGVVAVFVCIVIVFLVMLGFTAAIVLLILWATGTIG